MIAEEEFHTLVKLLVARLGDEQAGQILHRAGERTADYVQANRIPAPMRSALKLLPGPLSLRLLLPAISKHAWTFAGSGAFRFSLGMKPFVSIGRPVGADTTAIAGVLCRYYYGAFGKMLRDLVSPRLALRETACQAAGGQACVYQIEM
jgi:divinyl protochlorophyllide a 8-vinyl-reductase